MITCPWCGTNYTSFQPNCHNCGGSLPLPPEVTITPSARSLVAPSPPPREVPRRALWHIMSSDYWADVGLILSLFGLVFALISIPVAVSLVTTCVGLPFLGLGLLLLCVGIAVLVGRCSMAQQTVEVLRQGEGVVGEIVSVVQNYQVSVNGRHPWTVEYDYEVEGRRYGAEVNTLSRPDLSKEPGSRVYVLFMRDDPSQSTIYPSPYGYYGF
jgi:membrane protein implicated in regulation of membrane protease activity